MLKLVSSRLDIHSLLQGLGVCKFDKQYDIISHIFFSNLSQEQFDTLTKCTKFGWRFSKIIWDDNDKKATMLITAEKIFAWVLPSGKLLRVENKKSPPYNWKENCLLFSPS